MVLNDKVLIHADLATMDDIGGAYGLIKNGALAISGGHIMWVGPCAELPNIYKTWPKEDHTGRLITPALIDCHTHIIHGGDRSDEFEMRLNGASYEDVSRAGGGIISTVTQTRAASEDSLIASALPRIDCLIAEASVRLKLNRAMA